MIYIYRRMRLATDLLTSLLGLSLEEGYPARLDGQQGRSEQRNFRLSKFRESYAFECILKTTK